MFLQRLRPLHLVCAALLLSGCHDDVHEVSEGGSSTGAVTGSTGPTTLPTATGMVTIGQTTDVADDTGTSATTASATTGPDDDCCSAHSAAGCDDPGIASCVCDGEAFCCAFEWDQNCVDQAAQCGACGAATAAEDTGSGSSGGPVVGACCDPSGSPGCPDAPGIEMCVCGLDAFCCDEQWNGMCVEVATNDCGAECMGGGGDCCAANGSPGCDDMGVTDCTCALDPFCCDQEWNDSCVSEAHYGCMAGCGLPPANEGDCCTVTDGPGCDDMAVTDCVCMIDNGCCLSPWDDGCIQQAVNSCALMCEGFEPQPPCCQVQMGPGCGDMDVENCVCAFDAFCCDTQWDDVCVDEAQNVCMLDCGVGMGLEAA